MREKRSTTWSRDFGSRALGVGNGRGFGRGAGGRGALVGLALRVAREDMRCRRALEWDVHTSNLHPRDNALLRRGGVAPKKNLEAEEKRWRSGGEAVARQGRSGGEARDGRCGVGAARTRLFVTRASFGLVTAERNAGTQKAHKHLETQTPWKVRGERRWCMCLVLRTP